jgi:hypothetical protein
MVYIGVDLHGKRSQLAAIDAAGEPIFNRSIASQPDEFLRVFGELGPEPIEVAFEATIGWGWFADLLADAGVKAHMAHPLATRAIATARVKNDEVDARTLAHLLRTNLLPEAWIAPLEVREARRLVRMRAGPDPQPAEVPDPRPARRGRRDRLDDRPVRPRRTRSAG